LLYVRSLALIKDIDHTPNFFKITIANHRQCGKQKVKFSNIKNMFPKLFKTKAKKSLNAYKKLNKYINYAKKTCICDNFYMKVNQHTKHINVYRLFT